jgi:cytochrome c biogenesis protein CcmG/thiol:disulfide interchange protein DsbE
VTTTETPVSGAEPTVPAGAGDDGFDDDAAEGYYDEERRGGPRAARIAAISVGVVLLLFIALLATRRSSEDRFGANPLVGKLAPQVTGTTLTGEKIDTDKLRGKWVIVNFFATWCTGCRVEHPELIKFSEAHRAIGDAEVVSVAFQDQPAALKSFFDKNGGDWPVVVDDTSNTALTFGITGIPESFVVAPNGRVVEHFNGVTAQSLDEVMNAYGGKDVTVAGQDQPSTGGGSGSGSGSGPGTTVAP